MSKGILTEAHKLMISNLINEGNYDLNSLTQIVFNNTEIDGRSKEGRAIRDFMIRNGIKHRTTKAPDRKEIDFTPEQLEVIVDGMRQQKSSTVIAQELFPDRKIKNLCVEQRCVYREMQKDHMILMADKPKDDNGGLPKYLVPKSTSRTLKKINDACGLDLSEEKLNRQLKICVERLAINLGNSRFVQIMNNFTLAESRELFEHEFVRLTWDKPDITSDEINLYMNVCKEIINLETISKNLNRLNDMFNTAAEEEDMSVRLSEIIKTKSSEYHQCENRIESLTKKLQGDRAERLKTKNKENASILSLVQFFQDEEERKNMVKMAEMQRLLVKEEAHRLEGMEEWKCRVLGISQEDII